MTSLTVIQNTRNRVQVKRSGVKNDRNLRGMPQSFAVRLKQKICELAELADWTARKIAVKAGVSPSTLYSAMERDRPINVSDAIALARVLDVSVEWLFDDKKGWPDLDRRPHWMHPQIMPEQEIRARRQLEGRLGVSDEAVADARSRRSESRPRDTTAGRAAKTPSRRKSAS